MYEKIAKQRKMYECANTDLRRREAKHNVFAKSILNMIKKGNSTSIFLRLHPYFLHLKLELTDKTKTNNICTA